MKSILFYLPSLSPSGGIERVVSTIANELCEKFEVTVLTQDSCYSYYYLDPRVKIITMGMYHELDMNNKLSRVLSQIKNLRYSVKWLSTFFSLNNYDYIYITHPISQIQLLFSGVNKNKIVISEHGASNNYNKFYRILKKLTYNKCKYYCVPTRYDFEYYSRFDFPVRYTPHYKPDLNYSNANINSKVVLNIGRYTNDKQQLELLNIWSNIPKNIRTGWTLKIVGNGELKKELSEFIKNHNLSESTILLEPRKDIEIYYKNASIFALTSRSEGFGMVLLEAAGFGIPLIAYDCPAGPRDIINKNNGYLIKVDDTNSYTKYLVDMMSNQKILESLSIGSVKLSSDWSNEKITKIWVDLLK